MLAAILAGPRNIQLEEVEDPQWGPHTMLLRIKATSICGSDLKRYRSTDNKTFPRVILGHEMTGEIIDKGEDVTQFGIGDRVVVQPAISCGKCQLCQGGRDNICPAGGMRGTIAPGGFAEYIVIDESEAYRLPDSIDYSEGTQIQTLATVYHSQKRLQLEAGQSVLIIGLGATGLLHTQLAKATGAMPIVVVDPFPWKLKLAKQLGADVAIRVSDESALDQIREATGGKGPDAVIEAVGIPSTVALAIETVSRGGKVLMFGSGHSPLTGFDPFLIYTKEILMIGTRSASRADWLPSIQLVETERIGLKPLVTHRVALQDIKKGFALMDDGIEGVIRVVVSADGGESEIKRWT
jgi:L-iditol 2-dehydrogenase